MSSETGIELHPDYQYSAGYSDVLCKFASYGMLVGLGGYFLANFMGWV